MNKYRIELAFHDRPPLVVKIWAKHMDDAAAKVKAQHSVTDSVAWIGRRISP